MLSRIANSLFWMGRYLERSEHVSRFMGVQYLSLLEAPLAMEKFPVMESVLHMTGCYYLYIDQYQEYDDEKVIHFCLLASKNPYSIKNMIRLTRENARQCRDRISAEAWDAINTFYHQTTRFGRQEYYSDSVYENYQQIVNHAFTIKGILDSTLLRNEVWHFINLGLHFERAIQILRMITIKMEEMANTKITGSGTSVESYHWVNLLRSACSFDMSRRVYRKVPAQDDVVEFLMFNTNFPNAVAFNLNKAGSHIEWISNSKTLTQGSVEFELGKLIAQIKYLTIADLGVKPLISLYDILGKINSIVTDLEQKYLSY